MNQVITAPPGTATTSVACCSVIELRQYITYPGRRDALEKRRQRYPVRQRAYDLNNSLLAQDIHWRDPLFSALYKSLARPPETLMLQPSANSMIR